MHGHRSVRGAQEQVQHPQGDPEGQFDGLGLRRQGLQQEVVLEPAQCLVGIGRDARPDAGAVGTHMRVEDREGFGDRRGGTRRDADRAEDVDVLPGGQPAAEVVDAQHRRGAFDRGDCVTQRDVAFAPAGVCGIDTG